MSTTGIDRTIDQIFQAHFAAVGSGVRPIQHQVIKSVVDGHNTLALMPTGGGKSLCYWIAGKALAGITLVIFPLTALMDEQALKLTNHGCKVFTLHSGIDARKQYQELIDLYNQREKPDFIFLSPERLATDGFLEYVLQSIREQIKLVVIDEAHCISQWGLDFRPFYREIPHFLRAIFGGLPIPSVLCLTATLNPKDREQICSDFGIEGQHVIKSDTLLRPTIDIRIVKVPNEDAKDEQFWLLMERHKSEKVLVYVDRRHGKRSTEALAAEAAQRGFRAAFFHGEMRTEEKAQVIEKFKSGELLSVFATSAFGMGIDIPDIRGVVHYLLTESTEQYYQQIGRVGRDQLPAWAVLFYSDKNVDVRRKDYIMKSFPGEQEVRWAFSNLTDDRAGRRTVNYFDEGDNTQSAYHYLVRSSAIAPVCKGIESLDVFRIRKGVSLPEFEAYRAATRTGSLLPTARNLHKPETEILGDVFHWVAGQKLISERSPGKCLIIDALVGTLPDDLLAGILADAEEKRQYRLGIFAQFIELLESFTGSMEFHKRIGEYLGIDKFGRDRIYQTLSGELVRSKSEVIIANILYQSHVPYEYEAPLFAPDGSWRLPDFTIHWQGRAYYWEHLGMLDVEEYEQDWKIKERWYHRHFAGQLLTTRETSTLSKEAEHIIATHFAR